MNNPITVRVSAVPKGSGTNAKMPASLDVFADDEKHGVKNSVLKFPSVFVQILNKMCSDTEMVHLYEYFVLCGTSLLSSYWNEASGNNNNKCKADKTRKE